MRIIFILQKQTSQKIEKKSKSQLEVSAAKLMSIILKKKDLNFIKASKNFYLYSICPPPDVKSTNHIFFENV